MVMSCCCKDLDLDDDDVDEDEEKVTVAEQGLWYRKSRSPESSEYYPIDEAILLKMRAKRVEEVTMGEL